MPDQDNRNLLSLVGSFVQLRSRGFAQRLLLVASLLVVGATSAQAHQFSVVSGGRTTQVPAGSTSRVNVSGPQATITVTNSGTETGCTTRVTATVQGTAVGLQQQGGGLGSTRTVSYTTPPPDD